MKDNLSLSVATIKKLAEFNREKIPERITHAKGTGAFGTFKVNNNLNDYTSSKLFSKGNTCPIFVRFSNYRGEKGTPDTIRDPRGFAIKFYTQEGNWDMVGNNIPIFYIRDARKLPDLIHSQRRHPVTNLYSNETTWKFFSENPETLHGLTMNFSRRGIPATYRHIHGYSCHAFSFYNETNERSYVKFHFISKQGIKTLTQPEADIIAGTNPDIYTEDLYDSIDKGNFPVWTVSVQIVKEEDLHKFSNDPFDVTKVWSHTIAPLIEIGEIVLNRIPENQFTDVEESSFSPANLIPGIGLSPDRLLQARAFSYSDAARHRLGVNYEQLPVNAPKCPFHSTSRDGMMRLSHSADTDAKEDSSEIAVHKFYNQNSFLKDEFSQVKALFQLFTEEQKEELAFNIAESMKGVSLEIIETQLELFKQVDIEYANKVKSALGYSIKAVNQKSNNLFTKTY